MNDLKSIQNGRRLGIATVAMVAVYSAASIIDRVAGVAGVEWIEWLSILVGAAAFSLVMSVPPAQPKSSWVPMMSMFVVTFGGLKLERQLGGSPYNWVEWTSIIAGGAVYYFASWIVTRRPSDSARTLRI